MIRHVILFKFRPGVTACQIAAAEAELATLPAHVPQIAEWSAGPDVGGFDRNYDYVIVAGFATLDDYVAYRDDPYHQELIEAYMKPILADYVRVQYDAATFSTPAGTR